MSSDAVRRRRGWDWSGNWVLAVAAVALTPVLLAAATVVADHLTRAEVATRVVRKTPAEDMIKRTLDIAQLVGDAVDYLDVVRRSGWR